MENADKIIVLLIVLGAAVFTWKMVFDFYKTRFHKIFGHVIAVATASFMFLSSMLLFIPKDYKRGATEEFQFSITSTVIVVVMLFIIYVLFRYLPNRKKANEPTMPEHVKKESKKRMKKNK